MMNYEQRVEYIRNWFRNDMLTRFSPPTGADPKAVASDTIEAVNNNIPSNILPEQMNSILSSLTKNVVHSARSRTLPIVKDFIEQTRKSTQALREGGQHRQLYRMESRSLRCSSPPYTGRRGGRRGIPVWQAERTTDAAHRDQRWRHPEIP